MDNYKSLPAKVYINQIQENLKTTIQKGLDYIEWHRYIDKWTRVFVKPYFTYPYYKEGVTTTPELLKALLEILKSRTDTIIVGESDGGNNAFTADEAFDGHNMYKICSEYGVDLVNLSTVPSKTIQKRVQGKKVTVKLPKMLLEEIDCFISVPVLKVHAMTTISLSLKNLWGCVPDAMRLLQHQNINYKLSLIAQHIRPEIVIVDGTYALDKYGPMFGVPIKMGLIIIANNPVAADELGAQLMGFSANKIKHLEIAKKAGLGPKVDTIQVNNDWQLYHRQFNVKRTLVQQFAYLAFHNDILARFLYASPFTPLIYKLVGILRSHEEKEVAADISNRHQKIRGYY